MEKKINVNEIGQVNISDEVVGIITNIAANEVEGVTLHGTFTSNVAEMLGKKNMTKGVKVELNEEDEVRVALDLTVNFGTIIPEVCKKVQESVKNSIETMTELKVVNVDVNVLGIVVNKPVKDIEE